MYRINKLVETKNTIFHTQDIAQLWGIQNQNTLHTTLSRYTKSGALHRIQKGLYSIFPVKSIDHWILGLKVLHRYGYVSTESILVRDGMIFQHSDIVTLVSSVSAQFTIYGYHYRVRQLADRFLYNPAGIVDINGIRQATSVRAIADLMYFNPQMHIDNNSVSKAKIHAIQKEVGYL